MRKIKIKGRELKESHQTGSRWYTKRGRRTNDKIASNQAKYIVYVQEGQKVVENKSKLNKKKLRDELSSEQTDQTEKSN